MNFPVLTASLAIALVTVILGHFGWLPAPVVTHLLAVLSGAMLPTSALAAKKAPVITTTLRPTAPDSQDSGDISPLLKVEIKNPEIKS